MARRVSLAHPPGPAPRCPSGTARGLPGDPPRLRRARARPRGTVSDSAAERPWPARRLARPGRAGLALARRFLPVVPPLPKVETAHGRKCGALRLSRGLGRAPGRTRPPRLLPPPTRGPERSGVILRPRRCVTPIVHRPTGRRFTPRRGTPHPALVPTIVTVQPHPSTAAGADPRRPIRLPRHALSVVVSAGAASAAAPPSTPPGAVLAADHSAAIHLAAVLVGAVTEAAVSVVEATAEEAEATGKAQAAHSYHITDQKLYEITRLMKTEMVKAAGVVLCLAALVATYGCATPQNSTSVPLEPARAN